MLHFFKYTTYKNWKLQIYIMSYTYDLILIVCVSMCDRMNKLEDQW
jgi:hypothetical protein